jgi:peptidoglycan/xylan/chitin deacetylase (PgdA/CDA1 family)
MRTVHKASFYAESAGQAEEPLSFRGMRALLSPAIALLLSALTAASATPLQDDRPQSRWPGRRQAAIALTYDDALASQLDVAIPQLDAAGLKGTFFLMGRQVGDRVPDWRRASSRGHELGNHTVNHPCARGTYDMPAQYTSEAYTVELLMTDIRVMNGFLQAMDGRPAHAFATPCGQNIAGGQDYLAPLRHAKLASHVRDARTMPQSVRYTSFSETSGADMIRWVEDVRRAGAAGVIVFHGVGGDYLTVSGDAHRELVAYLKAQRAEIWTATFSEVMDAATR